MTDVKLLLFHSNTRNHWTVGENSNIIAQKISSNLFKSDIPDKVIITYDVYQFKFMRINDRC